VSLEAATAISLLRTVVVDRAAAGSSVAQISLKHLHGKLTLRVTATDSGGARPVRRAALSGPS